MGIRAWIITEAVISKRGWLKRTCGCSSKKALRGEFSPLTYFIDERIKRKKSEEIIRMLKLEVDRIEIEPLYNVNLISEESKRYLYVSPNWLIL